MLGALSYVELGTSVPESGAEYVYITRSYGELAGFLYTWTACLVTKPVSFAIITVVCAEYILKPFYDTEAPVWLNRSIAIAMIAVITLMNVISVRLAVKVTDIFTTLKVLALALIIIVGLVFLGKHAGEPNSVAHQNLHNGFSNSSKCNGDGRI